MGRAWLGSEAWSLVHEASRATDRDIEGLLVDASADELLATRNTQVALFVLECVIASEVRGRGIEPDVVAGHSVGEFSALWVAGMLRFVDAVRIVNERAVAMSEASTLNPGGMAAVVGLDVVDVMALCREDRSVWLSADNAPLQSTVGGAPEALEWFAVTAKARGAKRVVPLRVSGAFHTPLMAPAEPRFAEALNGTPIESPRCPVIANVDGLVHSDPTDWPALLKRQLQEPVRWRTTTECLAQHGVGQILELGPKGILGAFVRRTSGEASALVDSPDAVSVVADTVAKLRRVTVLSPAEGEVKFHLAGCATTEGTLVETGSMVGSVGEVPIISPCGGWMMEELVHDGQYVSSGEQIATMWRI